MNYPTPPPSDKRPQHWINNTKSPTPIWSSVQQDSLITMRKATPRSEVHQLTGRYGTRSGKTNGQPTNK